MPYTKKQVNLFKVAAAGKSKQMSKSTGKKLLRSAGSKKHGVKK